MLAAWAAAVVFLTPTSNLPCSGKCKFMLMKGNGIFVLARQRSSRSVIMGNVTFGNPILVAEVCVLSGNIGCFCWQEFV